MFKKRDYKINEDQKRVVTPSGLEKTKLIYIRMKKKSLEKAKRKTKKRREILKSKLNNKTTINNIEKETEEIKSKEIEDKSKLKNQNLNHNIKKEKITNKIDKDSEFIDSLETKVLDKNNEINIEIKEDKNNNNEIQKNINQKEIDKNPEKELKELKNEEIIKAEKQLSLEKHKLKIQEETQIIQLQKSDKEKKAIIKKIIETKHKINKLKSENTGINISKNINPNTFISKDKIEGTFSNFEHINKKGEKKFQLINKEITDKEIIRLQKHSKIQNYINKFREEIKFNQPIDLKKIFFHAAVLSNLKIKEEVVKEKFNILIKALLLGYSIPFLEGIIFIETKGKVKHIVFDKVVTNNNKILKINALINEKYIKSLEDILIYKLNQGLSVKLINGLLIKKYKDSYIILTNANIFRI